MSGLPLDLVGITRRESEDLDLGNVDDLLTSPNDLYPLFKRTVSDLDSENSFIGDTATTTQEDTFNSKKPAYFEEFISDHNFTNLNSNPICWSAVDAPQIATKVIEASTASSSSTTSIESKGENKTLTNEQTLLRAKINHPEKSWKEISELNDIHYSEDSIHDIFSRIKTEYDSDPSSIDKYVQEGYLSKDELVALFKKSHLDMDVTVLNNQQLLLRAKLDHPEMNCRQISELENIPYTPSGVQCTFSGIRTKYTLDHSSIDRYVKEGYLSKAQIEKLLKSPNPHKEATLKKHQALLRAKLDHPNKTWKEICARIKTTYSQNCASKVFSRIRVNYYLNPNSINKYVQEGYLTKEELDTLFKSFNSNKDKLFNKKSKTSLEKQRKLLRAKIDHPEMTWKEIADLEEVDYKSKTAKGLFSVIKLKYKEDASSIDQYVENNYLTREEIKHFFDNPSKK